MRLRTVGTPARGREIVEHDQIERMRRRLKRAGWLRGGPGLQRAAACPVAHRVALARGLQRAAACPGGGPCRAGARCPGGGGVSRGRAVSRWRAVSGGQRRVQGARRGVPARGGHSDDGSGVYPAPGLPLCCVSGYLGFFHVGFTWNTSSAASCMASMVVLASGGHCCACQSQRGLWPRAKSGRSRRTGKRAIRGAIHLVATEGSMDRVMRRAPRAGRARSTAKACRPRRAASSGMAC